MEQTLSQFPAQKIPTSKRTEDWWIENINAGLSLTSNHESDTRASFERKAINYDLANGLLQEDDIEKVFNVMSIKNYTTPSKTQNYPVELPFFNVLIGEELNRGFDWRVVISDEDAISEKQVELNAKKKELILQEIQNTKFDPNDAKRRLDNLQKYLTFEYKDIREVRATRVLNYLWKNPDISLPLIFNKGFHDVLIAGEEIYDIDVIQGDVSIKRLDPLTVYTVGGNSHRIEDSDMIVIDDFITRGQAQDYYYDELTDAQVEQISSGRKFTPGTANMNYVNISTTFPTYPLGNEVNGMIVLDDRSTNLLGSRYNDFGNIRRTRVLWKSKRKLGELSYINEEGDEDIEIVDENYKANTDKGEKIKWFWVNEWLEGTKLGEDIYVKMQVVPVQYRKMNNKSECYPGIVGTKYNVNSSKCMSLMDRIKPYKYLYNVIWKRTEIAFAKHKGPIIELDLARIPDDNIDKWMGYAESMGYLIVDSAKEINKGVSKGKLAGDFNTTGKLYNADMGNYISQHLQMLDFLERKIGDIAGVPPQRLGAVSNRETVGGIDRSLLQSSHVTEEWFFMHDNTKSRVLHACLEASKFAWRGKSKKLQYIDDGLSNIIFDIDGDEFYETEYSVFVSNSKQDLILMQKIEQLAHAGLQTDKLSFSQIMDIYSDESITSIRRKIEKAEYENAEKQSQMAQSAMQAQSQQEQVAIQLKQEEIASKERTEMAKLEMDKYKAELERETKIMDADRDGVPDHVELSKVVSKEKIELEKLDAQAIEREDTQRFESEENEKDRQLEREKIEKQNNNKNLSKM
jgi:hypothetical protein